MRVAIHIILPNQNRNRRNTAVTKQIHATIQKLTNAQVTPANTTQHAWTILTDTHVHACQGLLTLSVALVSCVIWIEQW